MWDAPYHMLFFKYKICIELIIIYIINNTFKGFNVFFNLSTKEGHLSNALSEIVFVLQLPIRFYNFEHEC